MTEPIRVLQVVASLNAGGMENYLKRAIQNKLEDRMAEEILDGKIHRGDRVIVSVSKKVIKFSVND